MDRHELLLCCTLCIIITVGTGVLWERHQSAQITPVVIDRQNGEPASQLNVIPDKSGGLKLLSDNTKYEKDINQMSEQNLNKSQALDRTWPRQ